MKNYKKNIPDNGTIRKADFSDIKDGAIVWIATIDECSRPILVQLEVEFDTSIMRVVDEYGNSIDDLDDLYIIERSKNESRQGTKTTRRNYTNDRS